MKSAIQYECTIIIPTRLGREKYIQRILNYYNKDFNIIVVGHTNFKLPSYVKYLRLKDKFNFKIFNAILKVKTNYFLICADDDFVFKQSIKYGLGFLKKNKSYYSFQGNYYGLFYKKFIYFSELYRDINYKNYSHNNYKKRMLGFFSDYMQLFYSIHRTYEFQKKIKKIKYSNIDGDNFFEFIISFIAVCNGRNKYSNIPWGLREISTDSFGALGVAIKNLKYYKKNKKIFFDNVIKFLNPKYLNQFKISYRNKYETKYLRKLNDKKLIEKINERKKIKNFLILNYLNELKNFLFNFKYYLELKKKINITEVVKLLKND